MSLHQPALAQEASMSFAFADSLPASDWAPPAMLLLYEVPVNEGKVAALALPTPCEAWAATERMGL